MGAPSAHAKLRPPSGAEGWFNCTQWLPSGGTNSYAVEGSCAHWVGSEVLDGHLLGLIICASDFIGQTYTEDTYKVTVDQEMADYVQGYVDYVLDLVKSTGGTLMVEQKLPIGQVTLEDGAKGTSDIVILAGDELIVCDLKYGAGVKVSPVENKQLALYWLGAYDEFNLAGDFTKGRLVIYQPRGGGLSVSEWDAPLEWFEGFRTEAQTKSKLHGTELPAVAGEDQCRYCAHAATCETLRNVVMDDFENVDPKTADAERLAVSLAKTGMIEGWIKAVRGAVETRLLQGQPVPGYKLVQGKKGNRKWSDPAAAEALLKGFRLKVEEMYDLQLVSPTTAEKLAKDKVIGPRQWPKALELITQSEGGLSVAPESDKRPAHAVTSASASDFDDVTTTETSTDLA